MLVDVTEKKYAEYVAVTYAVSVAYAVGQFSENVARRLPVRIARQDGSK